MKNISLISIFINYEILYFNNLSGCGGILTNDNGFLSSPGYPNSYQPNSNCVWTIRASPGKRIRLSFRAFDLEHHRTCNYDSVIVSQTS